jgi:hypothetical protein
MTPPKSKRYFVQEHLLRNNIYDGGIGNKDIERVLIREGFKPLLFPFHFDFSLKAKIMRSFYLFRLLFALPSRAVIVFQFPLYARIHQLLIRMLGRFRSDLQLICFITDINGLKDGDQHLLRKEIRFLKSLRLFIVHNKAMADWLLQQNSQAKTAAVGFFDFLAEPFTGTRQKSHSLAFAGYLDKSAFVKHLQDVQGLMFHVYGPMNSRMITESSVVLYHGVLQPQDLPESLQGSFGLIWDGESVAGLSGVFGDYNQYISPHKLSLYMLAGLPVIAHENAGAAALIRQYRIGFTVQSLPEIEQRISSVSEVDYQEMRRNCLHLAGLISKGRCLPEALAQLTNPSSAQ